MPDSATQTAIEISTAAPDRVLIVEDSLADSELLSHELRRSGFDSCGTVMTKDDFLKELKKVPPEVILTDYNLGEWRGMDVLDILRQQNLDIPVILVSGMLGDETAVECIKQGAADYVLKDNLKRLPWAIRRALQEKKLRSEQREAEIALDQKVEELARSNRDLEQFAYVASHDLQEPLRMVSAYTQLLAERYKGKLDEQADKYIYYAVDGATRMQELIHDLLRFSRAGREGTVLQATDCNVLVERAMQNLQAAVEESGATIKYGDLPTVTANPVQLEQVFQNLISNAIKFRNGRSPAIEISAKRVGAKWIFSISDNGIGIAPEHAQIIFAVFQRLHARTEYSGNGIGLAICKKIIEQLGGEIWLENRSGPGATFNFSIPAIRNGVSKE